MKPRKEDFEQKVTKETKQRKQKMNLMVSTSAHLPVLRGPSAFLCLSFVTFVSFGSNSWFSASLILAADTDFEKQVAPILVQNCLQCHNNTKARAGLNLSSRASVLKGSDAGEVLVPGKPQKSLLIQRADDGSMPPETDGRRLTAEEVAMLSAWVQAGAMWPEGRILSPAANSASTGFSTSHGRSQQNSKRPLVGRVLQHFRPRRNLPAAE